MYHLKDGIYIEWAFGHFGNKLAFSEHNNKESNQDLFFIMIRKELIWNFQLYKYFMELVEVNSLGNACG